MEPFTPTHSGGCLCGGIRYEVRGPLREILVCHCEECRRWAGRAWAATAARAADLELVEARSLRWLASPRSESSARRGFCAECGSSLFWEAPGRDTVSIGAGTLDDSSGLCVAGHIWLEQAAGWEAVDGLPGYPRGYPAGAPALAWR